MAIKQFQGEVIESKDASFNGRNGELVNLWEISVYIDENTSRRFLVGVDSVCRKEAEACIKGHEVRVSAEPIATIDGKVKWRAIQIEQVKDTQPQVGF